MRVMTRTYQVPGQWFVTMGSRSQRFFKRFFTESEAYDYAFEVGGDVQERLLNEGDYQEIW